MTGPGYRGRSRVLTVAGAVSLCAVCCPPLFLIPAAFVAGGTAGLGTAISGLLGTAGSLVAAALAVTLLVTGLLIFLRSRRRREPTVTVDLPVPVMRSQSRSSACEQ